MMSLLEMMLSTLVLLSLAMQDGKSTKGQVSRVKAGCSVFAREITRLAREICGGNGILLENHVMKALVDAEAMYTYEGTYEVQTLVSGRELTGGLYAFN